MIKEISQASLSLDEKDRNIQKIILLNPLTSSLSFEEQKKLLSQRRWSLKPDTPISNRLLLKFKSYLFKYLPKFVPKTRLTKEMKLKTVLAILFSQNTVREYLLNSPKKREEFYKALKQISNISIPDKKTPLEISKALTEIPNKKTNLIDNLEELNLQIAALPLAERNEILYHLLDHIERPAITSTLELKNGSESLLFPITTQYTRYKVLNCDAQTGEIEFEVSPNRATSSVCTHNTVKPDAKGTLNQRIVFDHTTGDRIGSYCGELTTSFHALEQILMLIDTDLKEAHIVDKAPDSIEPQEIKLFFTSLFSWNELGSLLDEHTSLQTWNQKILRCDNQYYCLNLLHFNISFNALNKYPTPTETAATIRDLNEESLIALTWSCWQYLMLDSKELEAIANRLASLYEIEESQFFKKQKFLLEEIDAFRELKPQLIEQLETCPFTPLNLSMLNILSEKRSDGKKLRGIDLLIHLDLVLTELRFIHNKNCLHATDRSAGADAADKAQYVYHKLTNTKFLPGSESEEESSLFKLLYSMYLVWEEPELTTALSTGFLGEKFYKNFFFKNPETTRYLNDWLKKHPELYLGLSHLRT